MLKSEEKRESFDIWVCKKEPFTQMFIKNTIMCSWEKIEIACTILNKAIPESNDIVIAYDLTANRNR